jgi:hypothetical protein
MLGAMAGKGMMFSLVSVPKAIGAGAACGLFAILLWVAFTFWPSLFVLPYVIALAATAVCGAFVLLATWRDTYRNPRRGVRIRPIRGFDVAAGLLLTVPTTWALLPFLGAF